MQDRCSDDSIATIKRSQASEENRIATEFQLDALVALCHRRWSLPVLAAMAGGPGLRFAELAGRLGVSRQPLRDTLNHLVELDYMRRRGGHGHPLRPEYHLAEGGEDLAAAVADLLEEMPSGDLPELLLRKWSLPLLAVLATDERRFADFRTLLPGLGPRALALALRDLEDSELVARRVGEGRPPTVRYSAASASDDLLAGIEAMLSRLD